MKKCISDSTKNFLSCLVGGEVVKCCLAVVLVVLEVVVVVVVLAARFNVNVPSIPFRHPPPPILSHAQSVA